MIRAAGSKLWIMLFKAVGIIVTPVGCQWYVNQVCRCSYIRVARNTSCYGQFITVMHYWLAKDEVCLLTQPGVAMPICIYILNIPTPHAKTCSS